MKNITYSPYESRRFNLNVHRGKLNTINPNKLKDYILRNEVDLLILRFPSNDKANHNKLANLGFDYLHADVLVYYQKDLTRADISQMQNELRFELLTESNFHYIEEMIPVIFKGYQNHFSSNSYLKKIEIIDGYTEWVKHFCNLESSRVAWLITKRGGIAGFATCAFDPASLECEGVLYGVMPQFAGVGVYSDIIRFTQNYFKSRGYRKMLVSTQVQNYAVQSAWINEGFKLTHSFDTYHINPMLTRSISNKIEMDMNILKEASFEFANLSGGQGPLYYNDELVETGITKNKIVHPIIVQAYLSKIFYVAYPGKRISFVSNKNIFLSKINFNKAYKIILSTIKQDRKGLIRALAKVVDEAQNVYLLSYNDFIKR